MAKKKEKLALIDPVTRRKKKTRRFLTAIILLLLLAVFFKTALVGYSFLALFLFFLALIVLAYFILSFFNTPVSRGLRTTLTVLVVLMCAVVIAAEIPLIACAHKREKAKSDYCIVLGAGVHGTRPSRVLNERINAAYDFLTEHPETIAVLSGGQGSDEEISEAECMFRELTQKGIDASRLIKEEQSTSTEENMMFSADVLQKIASGITEVTVISSETHLYRASCYARRAGLTPSCWYAKTAYPVLRATYSLRECAAIWLMWIF